MGIKTARLWRIKHAMKIATIIIVGTMLISLALAIMPSQHTHANQALAARRIQHRLQIINMDLDYQPKVRPVQGKLTGYNPAVANLHVGDRVQFVNIDDLRHTATGFSVGGQTVPEHYKFAGDPTKRSGSEITAHEWSTGVVAAHGKSQIFTVKLPGMYYYGCAYHLGNGMRAAIIVKR
jgi:plastocyanin